MLFDLCYYFVLFFIYSFLGYLLEVVAVSITEKKLVFSRGYLIGPFIPIYAFGALFMLATLSKYQNDLIVLFVMSMISCCILEFFTSYIMEKIFKLRWWDYSDKLFNVNGRICLSNGVGFGIAGVCTIKFINPLLVKFLGFFSNKLIIVFGIIFFVILFSDFIFSTFTILKLQIDTSKYINIDATAKVKEEVMKSLNKYRIFHNRLFGAFPNLLKIDGIGQVKDVIKKYRNKIIKDKRG